MIATGYLHPDYTSSLDEFGKPYTLRLSQGTILQRQIPGTLYYDAMGCYPLFVCQKWSSIKEDIKDLENKLVSLFLVTDPFGNYNIDLLKRTFSIVKPFKHHFITDLHNNVENIASKHHLYYARRSMQSMDIEQCINPEQYLSEWIKLYQNLIQKHNITGIRQFSEKSFTKLLTIPGIIMLRAFTDEDTIAMHLWFIQGDVAYSHLAASSEKGYLLNASYALYWYSIRFFSDKVRWLDLGSGSGLRPNNDDGLSWFKQGWASSTQATYFCGHILNAPVYNNLVKIQATKHFDYFPAYRAGEFS